MSLSRSRAKESVSKELLTSRYDYSRVLAFGVLATSWCRSTKTQVNPSSALNRTKHHQSNPSNVPRILDSNLSGRACIHSSKILGNLLLIGSLTITGSGSPTGFLPSGFTTFLVYLTSIVRVRGVSLCSLERQDSLLLQGLKVAEDPLFVILTSTLPLLLLTGNRVAELTLTAFQSESGLQVTQRLPPSP